TLKKNSSHTVLPITVAPRSSNLRITAACEAAGGCAASQSGSPPPVRAAAMSYMSFTATVSPASGPSAVTGLGAGKTCGSYTPRKWCDADMLSSCAWREIPIEDPGAVPRDHAGVAENLLERALHVTDSMRNARQVGVTGDRHDLRPLARLLIQAAKLIECPRIHDIRGMVLERHHHDVMNLEIVGKRDNRAVGGLECDWLVVQYPVADIFDAGFREVIERVERLRQSGAEPSARPPPPELLDDIHRFVDGCPLVIELVHRHLVVAVGIEFPSVVDASLDHLR